MNLNQAYRFHKGAITLEKSLTARHRKFVRGLLGFFVVAAILYGTVALITGFPYGQQSAGIAFVSGALLILMWLFETYFNSFYFFGLDAVIDAVEQTDGGCTYEVACIVHENPNDLAAAFATSMMGREALLRLGIPIEAITDFASAAHSMVSAEAINIKDNQVISFEAFGLLLEQHDPTFASFMRDYGVLPKQFSGTLAWIGTQLRARKDRQHWWSKDNLSKTASLGREWSYGQAHHLEQFAKDIRASAVFANTASDSAYAKEKVEEIESTLAREVSANVLLVGEAGVGKMDLLIEVSQRLATGKALQAIANYHIVVLDTTRIFTLFETKQEIEDAIVGLFSEAVAAGNVIVVIEGIASFIHEAAAIDIHIPELLDRFLASPELHIIVTETPSSYHTNLEPLRAFTRRFQEILVDPPDSTSTMRLLFGAAQTHERNGDTLFTYPALQAVVSSAERHIVNGVMPDKAIQLLADVYLDSHQRSVVQVTDDDVYKVVSDKTGIPAGPIQADEKEQLLNLEEVLHKKVIGQDRAVTAIAKTMRRARAGIQAPDRPLGSFLFLGPTGVGKTETAKALASVFFGDESAISRIDMSEFSGEDALHHLIGNVESAGVLPSILHDRPYCVLLLDEFEKASTAIHDLFLQVLDEGVFTDGRGQKINARNAIIIATSNAGSALIMKTVQQRNSMATLDASIIDHIIEQRIFKPELINRFDSTIIFEPLQEHEQALIAQLMLNELKSRIHEQGYTLTVTNKLLQALVEKGYSVEFGARPMRHLLQDLIEEKIAQKIIAGGVQKGDTIDLDVADFTPEELGVQAT